MMNKARASSISGKGCPSTWLDLDDFPQRGVSGGCCRPGRLVDVEGDPLGVTGPLLQRENQEYRSPSEDSGLGADMPRTRSKWIFKNSPISSKHSWVLSFLLFGSTVFVSWKIRRFYGTTFWYSRVFTPKVVSFF